MNLNRRVGSGASRDFADSVMPLARRRARSTAAGG
jgi:hypothetical protein